MRFREFAVIRCRKHPRYRGIRMKRGKEDCESCQLILILAHQHRKTAGEMLGGLNPFQFIDVESACEDLEIVYR